MFGMVDRLRDELRTVVQRLDASVLEAADAAGLVEVFAAIENLAASRKSSCAKRGADAGAWRSSGDRSAAHWLARTTATTVTAAIDTLETASRLAESGEVDAAVRSGELTVVQANEIASAAAAVPEAAGDLLCTARSASLVGLRADPRAAVPAALDR